MFARRRLCRAMVALIENPLPWAPQELPCLGSWQRCQAHSGAAVGRAAAAAAAAHRQARVLDGRAVAAAWQEELARDVRDVYTKGGRPPGLGVVLVGSRPDSLLYVSRKREACEKVGMFVEVRQLSASVTQRQLEAAVTALCKDPRIDGVLVQLPLPPHIDEEAIIESFDPQKDVDGFHPLNMGRILMRGRAARFIPCTALGVIELLQRSGVAMRGRSVVVMGDSNIVGMPLAMLFRDAGAATVTVLHRTSYRELFTDSTSAERAQQRAAADACLPRIPGPVARHAAGFTAAAPSGGAAEQADEQSSGIAPHPYRVDYSSTLRQAYSPQGTAAAAGAAPGPPEAQQQQEGEAHGAAAAAAAAGGRRHANHNNRNGAQHHQPAVSDLPGITRTADILVVAVGYPQLVRKEWVKPGAVVIDVGINVVDPGGEGAATAGHPQQQQQTAAEQQQQEQEQCLATSTAGGQQPGGAVDASRRGSTLYGGGPPGAERPGGQAAGGYPEEGDQLQHPFHVVGDVDFCDVGEVAAALTPVPGGVGPMTIAAVLHNTVQAARYNMGLQPYS